MMIQWIVPVIKANTPSNNNLFCIHPSLNYCHSSSSVQFFFCLYPVSVMMEEKEHKADYSSDTWLSLLGLLHPSEFLVTIDQKDIWRKHVAWSKPQGKDLQNYTTQRFSSNMVFLSLILAAEMNVLFNSSVITTDIRTQMMNGNYGSVRLWIGLVILLSACITVIALVTTFTLWGMVSSIGDKNAHCLLRSSIGGYVTSLPSKYVVASLYLFLGWLVLFIIELTKGPMRIVLLLFVMYLFFQTVVSLSAFGRLIIHTGAMSNQPVLDPALEKALLPSGLHASLLIKATDRKRRRTSVVRVALTKLSFLLQPRSLCSNSFMQSLHY